ncbi:MAG: carboxylesterase family protein [Chloroflexi bacterium]|nr:carboxylesterase family protein [Chloroflexota bacterium]
MKNVRQWLVSALSISIVLTICLGLACVSAPAIDMAVDSKAVGIGALDALSDLESQISALPDSAFTDPNHRNTLLNNLDDAINQVENGGYKGALNKLDKDVKNNIKEWIVAAQQPAVLDSVDVAIVCTTNASLTTVKTVYGKVAGTNAGNDSWVWKGIPYAKPPVGALRWKAPQDPDSWQIVRHSTDTFTPATQPVMSLQWMPANQITGSEDCLYLNIFRPKIGAKNLPVYIWIHGGANFFGGAHRYDASLMASKCNMVVVVIQYRLGPFGWFIHPALNAGGSSEDRSGNYGTLDTIQVLKWVRNNIAAFGGNPDNVAVAGQSAGGFNTMNLIISPLAKGLFHKAISQSAGGGLIPVETGVARANAIIDKLLVADKTCPDLAAATAYRTAMTNEKIEAYLKGKTTHEIMRAAMNDRGAIDNVSPFIDGAVIPGKAADIIASGNYNHVPIILGSTEDELKPFMPLYGAAVPTSTGQTWFAAFKIISGELPLDTVFATSDKLIYDACGKYPSLNWKAGAVDSVARLLTDKQDNVYCYFFKWGGSGSGPAPLDFLYGAGHSLDISFFFGWDSDTYGIYFFNSTNEPGRVALQQAMMSYLANFARTGDPNGSGLPVWAKWSNVPGEPKSITFNASNTEADIVMENWEITRADALAQIDALPLPSEAKSLIKRFLIY